MTTKKIITDAAENSVEQNPKKMTRNRIMSIDLFRGALLCIMVMDHSLLYFGDETSMNHWIYCFINDGIAGWGAGGFLMMMGASQALSAKRMGAADNMTMFKKAAVRGLFLFFAGLTMLLITFGPSDIWRWDILTLMGFATIILFFCRSTPVPGLIAIVAAIAILSPALRGIPAMDFEWDMVFVETPFLSQFFPGMYIDPTSEPNFFWRLDHIFKGFFVWGEFPVFPWLLFPIIGLIAGRRIVSGKFATDIPLVTGVSVLMIMLSFAGAYMGCSKPSFSVVDSYITPFCFYPDSFTMIVYQIGLSVLVFSLLFYIFDVKAKSYNPTGKFSRIIKRTSDFSLTFYFIHYIFIGWPLIIAHAMTGRDYERDLMPLEGALAYGIAVIVCLEFIIYRWEKNGGKYSLEWLLTILVKKVVKDYRRSV